jgi:transcriptional regulator with GAF, ATPase, and Fis domain
MAVTGNNRHERLICWQGVDGQNPETKGTSGCAGAYPSHRCVPVRREPGADVTPEFAGAEDLRELHGALVGSKSVEEFLHEMAVLAARLVSGGLSCGMTMQPNGRPVTVACSDQVAARVDEVQYDLDDGPCLHAMRGGRMVRIEDTADKARWPEFEARAASHGLRSCLALPLQADGRPVGALNLYARAASAFGVPEARRAEDFAENASGALTLAIRLASHSALIEQLRSSLASRTVIDQALGIIMAREQCTQARAFAILRSVSQNSNTKLRDIASAIVTSVTGEPPQPGPPFEDGQS